VNNLDSEHRQPWPLEPDCNQTKVLPFPAMSPEFDSYAPEYRNLLYDPIRDRFANDSQFFHRRKARLIHDFFARQNVSTAGMAWLDVGCGQGELLKIAGSAFARAVGCDPSAKMMQACAGIEMFEQPSPTELPFPNRSFDFITAACVFHHVPLEQRAALTASIYRILRLGGVFCLIEHNPFNPITQIIVKRCPVDSDAELLTASTASGLMRSADLEIIETAYFLYLPERLFNRIGWIERYLRPLPAGGQFATFSRRD
jgi:SAM-dependent methyltransferase